MGRGEEFAVKSKFDCKLSLDIRPEFDPNSEWCIQNPEFAQTQNKETAIHTFRN